VNEKPKPRWAPGAAVNTAYQIASREFADIARKGGDIPYLSHLLAVSALVIEHDGTEDQAAAALLHDVLEDRKVSAEWLTTELIAGGVSSKSAHFITNIVEGTSDGEPGGERSKATWRERKADYHASLAAKPATDPSLLVSLADKVHNIESTLVQVRAGETLEEIFKNFNAGRGDQQWNYEELHKSFAAHAVANPQLERLVTRFGHAIREVFAS
jgi:(p)ppGpp synthase/HD superfamily hydrolase